MAEQMGDDVGDQMGDAVDDVKAYYRKAAMLARSAARDVSTPGDERWGSSRYDQAALAQLGSAASDQSMGCGDPAVLAALRPGEVVLDLGSGAGLDVLLAAARVGRGGRVYGVDFLPEMIELATANAAAAGVTTVEFLEGRIEEVPLPDASVDVIISNCVINLAPDKAPVFREMARVLRPGGRVAVSDVVGDDDYEPPHDGAAWADCGAGALSRRHYLDLLSESGLVEVAVDFTHDVGPGLHGATVSARRPG